MLYFAYGSNLNRARMAERCPGARAVGTAVLDGYRLLCRTGDSGTYLTCEPVGGSSVPLGVWEVVASDCAALDEYEGYPRLYRKLEVEAPVVRFGDAAARCERGLVYVMYEHFEPGVPAPSYVEECAQGYRDFGFCLDFLYEAVSGRI